MVQVRSVPGLHLSVFKLNGGGTLGTHTYDAVTILENSGYVGIGVTAPNEKLEVEGNIRVGTSTNKANIEAGNGVPSHSAPKGTLYINTGATGSTNRLYINTNGSTSWAYIAASA